MSNGSIRIPLKRRYAMIAAWAGSKLSAQVKAVAFVVVYLIAVQTLVLKQPIENPLSVGFGIMATAVGLAFFLEGLFLGVMPLGERCGLKLPGKAGSGVIAIFALILGVTATLAEPAIGILALQGGAAKPWSAPLLFLLLNRGSSWLVAAIAVGVGLAVVVGMFRFLYSWRLKPFLFAIIPILIAVGFVFDADPKLRPILGLAWDTGGVTTGPVTVPLVIALGIGVSRIVGSKDDSSGGLGVVTLASALPVAAVMALAVLIAPHVPAPCEARDFFSQENRKGALFVSGSQEALCDLALAALQSKSITQNDFSRLFPDYNADAGNELEQKRLGNAALVRSIASGALKAVLPLALVLIVTLVFLLKDKLHGADEMFLGLAFAVIGMFIFGIGMEKGLDALGTQTGINLPRAYAKTERPDRTRILRGVTEADTFKAAGSHDGKRYLWVDSKEGPVAVPFQSSAFNPESGTYTYVPVEQPVFEAWGQYAGLTAALVFMFILGFGVTLAEPSLAALGATVEELTTGTYKRTALVATVAVGVGIGIAVGFSAILFQFSFAWILGVPYVGALLLTAVSSEDFAAIAWDSAGVTTGPITVPLVIATGLGIGGTSGAASSFGVVASASVFPVLAVLATGLWKRHKAKNAFA